MNQINQGFLFIITNPLEVHLSPCIFKKFIESFFELLSPKPSNWTNWNLQWILWWLDRITPALTATTLLPNLLHSPLFPPIQLCHHNQPTRHSLHPSSHACLSNHSTAGSTCQLVSPSLQHATFAGVVKTGSSSASPYLANDNATAEFASAVSPIYGDNSLLAADSPSAPSAGLNLVVAYPLQQDTSLPPSSPASPP